MTIIQLYNLPFPGYYCYYYLYLKMKLTLIFSFTMVIVVTASRQKRIVPPNLPTVKKCRCPLETQNREPVKNVKNDTIRPQICGSELQKLLHDNKNNCQEHRVYICDFGEKHAVNDFSGDCTSSKECFVTDYFDVSHISKANALKYERNCYKKGHFNQTGYTYHDFPKWAKIT